MTIIQRDMHNNRKAYWKHHTETVVGKTHNADGTAGTGAECALLFFLLSV